MLLSHLLTYLVRQIKISDFLFEFESAVKPVLMATSEQRPPVNNDRPKSPALLTVLWLYLEF